MKLAQQKGKMLLGFNISTYVHPVEMAFGKLHFSAPDNAPENLLREMKQFLKQETNIDWDIVQTDTVGGLSLKEQEKNKQDKAREKLAQTPLVSAILKTFDRAKISGFKLNKQPDEIQEEEIIESDDV